MATNNRKASTNKQTTRPRKQSTSHDSAWKDVIEDLFEDFLEFFFPEIHKDIDFSKKPEFLRKEFNSIKPYNKTGRRHTDQLVKVWLKNGEPACLCIFVHIEVQDRKEAEGVFGKRTYIYNYRIVDKYLDEGIKVVSLAILTDEDGKYRPNEHHVKQWGFELRMTFPIVKIIDYRDKKELKEKLEASSNPMAMVVKAQLSSFGIRRANDNKKAVVKLELIRLCSEQGYNTERIDALIRFIYWLILLPDKLNERIREELEEDDIMSHITSWEKAAEKRGVEIGEKRGVEIGEKIGVSKTAKMMLAEGLNIETISKYTGLSFEEIKKLEEPARDN